MRHERPHSSAIVLATAALASTIASALEANDIASIVASDEYDALHRLRTEGAELLVIDFDARGALPALRAVADEALAVTVLVLTASDDSDATLRALANGAHSCAPRSCSPAELHARIDALLRRPPPSRTPRPRTIKVGDITIDPAARSVWRAGQPLPIAAARFDVLLALARERGGLVPHARLRGACRRAQLREGSLRVIISDLRRRTGLRIRAVPRVGYVLLAS